MKRIVGLAAVVGLVAAHPAAAQLAGLPVYFSPKGGTGFTLSADYGRGLNVDSGKNNAFAGRVALGVSNFQIGLGVGVVNPEISPTLGRENQLNYAGHVAVRIIGGALIPVAVSLQAGVGYLKQEIVSGPLLVDSKLLSVPLGIGIGLNLPTPGFSFEPWVAPRVQITRADIGGLSGTETDLGVSGGINLAFLMGLGLHVGFDWINASTTSKPSTIGIGLHYTFSLPGLPGVPMVPGM